MYALPHACAYVVLLVVLVAIDRAMDVSLWCDDNGIGMGLSPLLCNTCSNADEAHDVSNNSATGDSSCTCTGETSDKDVIGILRILGALLVGKTILKELEDEFIWQSTLK